MMSGSYRYPFTVQHLSKIVGVNPVYRERDYRASRGTRSVDLDALEDYGPLQSFSEETPEGEVKAFVQVQLPNIERPRDVVIHLFSHQTRESHTLRLDGLGTAELSVPPGVYDLGIACEPLD